MYLYIVEVRQGQEAGLLLPTFQFCGGHTGNFSEE